jgi:hypothetical protein
MAIADRSLVTHSPTLLHWSAARRLAVAAVALLLLWGAVWWAIQ